MRCSNSGWATGVLTVLVLTMVAGCGDEDGPNPIPKASSTTPGPSVSPAPSAPVLTPSQEGAYKAAVQKYAEYQEFVLSVSKDPRVTPDLAVEAKEYVTIEAFDDFSKSIDELIRNGLHTQGRRQVAWTVPVRVKKGEVVFRQCETPGTWELVKGDKRLPQTSNTITRVHAVAVDGKWRVGDASAEDKRC